MANEVIRHIYNFPRDASVSAYRRKLGWLTISEARQLSLACLTYSALSENNASFLRDLLITHTGAHALRRQQDHQVVIPAYITLYHTYEHSCSVIAPIIWDAIPVEIKSSAPRRCCRLRLKEYFIAHSKLTGPLDTH